MILLFSSNTYNIVSINNDRFMTNISWTPSSNADGYIVYYGTKSGVYDKNVSTITPSISLPLSKCTTYYLVVKAKKGDCLSESSPELIIKPNIKAPVVQNGQLVGDRVKFEWNATAPQYKVNVGSRSGEHPGSMIIRDNFFYIPKGCGDIFTVVTPIYSENCIGPKSNEAKYEGIKIEIPRNLKIQ